MQAAKIVFVAVARSCGIPARLHPVTGEPQYYQNGAFYPVIESDKCLEQEYGSIVASAVGISTLAHTSFQMRVGSCLNAAARAPIISFIPLRHAKSSSCSMRHF